MGKKGFRFGRRFSSRVLCLKILSPPRLFSDDEANFQTKTFDGVSLLVTRPLLTECYGGHRRDKWPGLVGWNQSLAFNTNGIRKKRPLLIENLLKPTSLAFMRPNFEFFIILTLFHPTTMYKLLFTYRNFSSLVAHLTDLKGSSRCNDSTSLRIRRQRSPQICLCGVDLW